MTDTHAAEMAPAPDLARRRLPLQRIAAVALGTAWAVMATAETIIGDLDSLDDLAAMTAGSSTIAAAGLLHLLAAALLGVALAGLVPVMWAGRRSVVGRTGWSVALAAVPCLGAFGMLHLLAVETTADGLDPGAMEEFLIERLTDSAGPWAVPVLIMALLLPWALVLLAGGLTRLGVASWIAAALVALGALLHAFDPGDSWIEFAGHWVIAAGLAVAAVGVWRLRSDTSPIPAPGDEV
jgi:hypothetical protein